LGYGVLQYQKYALWAQLLAVPAETGPALPGFLRVFAGYL
jgi:hypothetical protein